MSLIDRNEKTIQTLVEIPQGINGKMAGSCNQEFLFVIRRVTRTEIFLLVFFLYDNTRNSSMLK